ncbi:hypothetical protein [Streptomyces sp. Go-475]|uniref:hypothetical protein n=1 Tax=Streptomyces sp. Go-475 TaxID=2072505 RepID=UPI0018E5645E|nr:hypothetical protein [Streptomyces sp. Go-475]
MRVPVTRGAVVRHGPVAERTVGTTAGPVLDRGVPDAGGLSRVVLTHLSDGGTTVLDAVHRGTRRRRLCRLGPLDDGRHVGRRPNGLPRFQVDRDRHGESVARQRRATGEPRSAGPFRNGDAVIGRHGQLWDVWRIQRVQRAQGVRRVERIKRARQVRQV